ncbi:hypothetical protein COCC4DRAFT_190830 [Bipolaris maydis ATCC 48331]|uniref:F-box domain-containing protein n=2 Tax=Cochliobolus heterostrophus TaxID=5016 RepID=M2U6B6_COCH5|nr:uncharacterized protein COCC4DRAFT_190830 [Bipolaris maydis ATCC 48331]EMD94059.1 hypothetical protein COCHEDRAFT_1222657 [Bipolaris maydis C5]KAJ6197505.1 hypothetical protein J3E72DRAFT_242930 [Bipolaris maydis]ENI07639.1 hypothetical protein COCC4DRAFT_190830 [Bipolaris maydis ATCC 48331]KAJ6209513.1 hypothetical protein PSV09DRAFT_1222657 [Bipolaris maydis]KAJ6271491.1 hypothetical protein PSV08DRAFT_361874 [Bipolaris maydis]
MDSSQMFRFLDLPGEIRNRIYEVVAETSTQTFPDTYPKSMSSRRRGLRPDHEVRRPPHKPFPFIGLTQTCTLIRKEFRPLWLSTHRFPLFALGGYFKAFFPPPLRANQASDQIRQRVARYYHPGGSLRIWLNIDSLADVDILPVIKFHLRFPMYTFNLISVHPKVTAEDRNSISTLIYNPNVTWVRYIKQHIITQVRLQIVNYIQGTEIVRIVLRESQVPDWMKGTWGHNDDHATTYRESLGLEELKWAIRFGTDYS